ncbi:MAG: peptidoglycan editing factor PgeF [Balneolaceae bacterium]|nr:peptidoglycan editing factor PgeF [Balneolaceae bacterium]
MKIIYPEIFSEIKSVSSLFTLANRDYGKHEKGLDLGLNTNSSVDDFNFNLAQLSKQSGMDLSNIALARQVHENRVQTVQKSGIYDDIDGFVTSKSNLALAIQVGDCAAILVADTHKRVIGAFHAGWRGAVSGIVPNGIRMMMNLGAEPKNMRVYLSACISLESFEVGPEVANHFPDSFCDYESFEKPHVDMKAFLNYQLSEFDIPQSQIQISKDCTVLNDQYFSFRRERENAGRMLAVIMLNETFDT